MQHLSHLTKRFLALPRLSLYIMAFVLIGGGMLVGGLGRAAFADRADVLAETEQSTLARMPAPMQISIFGDSDADLVLGTPNPLGEIVLGAADAPVTVIEYASMTCGHCGDFHNKVLPQLKADYVATGKVKFLFRPFPFDGYGMAGAMLAQCVPPRARLMFLDVIFARQQEWLSNKQPYNVLQAYAKQVGLSENGFKACLQSQETLDGIRQMQADASRVLGVNSTPTFFVNGEKVEGNIGVEGFRKILNKKLAAGDF
ncbi:MAG: DsbA family protein [Parvibaculales bacterium]